MERPSSLITRPSSPLITRPSSPLITRPSSPLITRPSSLIVRPSSLIVRPSSLITRRSSLIITRSSFRIACRSSSSKPKTNYDVFLSFRGETRNNFTSHLYEALCQKGIHTFLDDDELVRGKVISKELPKAIEGSRCSVVILSGDYASSRWCLDELVKILQCMKDLRQIVLPIFYHVDPSHVRKQIGSFGEAFRSHEQVFSHNLGKVKSWRAALAEVGNLAGYHLQDGNEAQFIQDFIKEVSSKLDGPLLNISKDLVGMDSRLEELKFCVSKSRFEDVGFIGICGMGGLGKTTLARAYFKYMSCQFEATSFLANVREVCEKDYNGLVKLQQQLLSDILRGEHKISNVYEGIGMITERLCDKKVLVILDDVDQLNQIEALAEKNNWFGPGSRIILTTRDESLLTSTYEEEEYVIHKVDILEYREALKLFSWKAFKKDRPLEDYIKLSKKVVEYANGLPLALEVLGSYLRGKSVNQWKSALDRLKEYPKKEITKVLQISFDGLEETEKSIFLDIACFFNGSRKDYIMRIMDSCGFFPEIGIRSLVDKSLLHMDHDDKLRMHDLLEEMGKEIVREKSRNEPGRRSRIWLRNDFYDVMKNNTGTEEVEAIACDYIGPERGISLRGFSNMKKLRRLILGSRIVDRQKDEYYLSNELRFLEWDEFPFNFFLPNFQPHGLVELILSGSRIKRLWNNPMEPLYNLKSIDLSRSTKIRKLEDFSLFPNLEKLILDHCEYLEEIDPSITVLKRLTLLSLESCRELKSLPTSMDGLESLKVLKLSHCSRLGNLPEDLGCLNNLEELDVRDTGIRDVPSSIRNLKALKSLYLSGCENLTSMGSELPNSLEIITAYDCRELHTFLDPLSQWDLRCSAIFCVNCFSMVKRQGSKRTAITSLGRYIQNPTSASKRFDIVLPGDEIPSWFTCQIWASSSIKLPLLPNWCNNKWMGFALSVSFRKFEEPHVMYWQIKINQQDWGFGHVYCLGNIGTVDNHHVWLLYLPRDTYFRTEWQNKFGDIQFSFKCRYAEETINKKFKIGGARLVYEQDIQELNRTARDEPIESMKLLSRNICDKDEDGVIPIDDNK